MGKYDGPKEEAVRK